MSQRSGALMRASWLLFVIICATAQADNLCDDPATTIEVNQCGQSAHQIAEEKLNTAYQDALHRIQTELADMQQQDDIRQALTEAQRLWVQYREKDCGAIYDLGRYGTTPVIRDSLYWSCMIKRTEQRIIELASFGLRE